MFTERQKATDCSRYVASIIKVIRFLYFVKEWYHSELWLYQICAPFIVVD
jgi:hypothetical protein